VLAWLARRLNAARFAGARNLRLVAGLSLGSRERILVVEVGDTQLVVGVAPGRVQTLHVLERPLPGTTADAPPAGEPFAARLARLMGGGGES
jgi:flagellar protein FliO/FliZ